MLHQTAVKKIAFNVLQLLDQQQLRKVLNKQPIALMAAHLIAPVKQKVLNVIAAVRTTMAVQHISN
jgi:hypothetical protein